MIATNPDRSMPGVVTATTDSPGSQPRAVYNAEPSGAADPNEGSCATDVGMTKNVRYREAAA